MSRPSIHPDLAVTAVVADAEGVLRAELARVAGELAAEARTPGLAALPGSGRRRLVAFAPWLVAAGIALAWRVRR